MKTIVFMTCRLLVAGAAFGQQGTTKTDCQINDNRMNCTSERVPTWDETFNKWRNMGRRPDQPQAAPSAPNSGAPQISAEAMKEFLAEQKREREAKDTVDFMYCRQNPKGGITDSEGKAKSCADVIEYTKAFCTVNIEDGRCKLAKSKAEVLKAFASLLDGYNSEKHKNREHLYYAEQAAKLTRWGCMSFPDMVLPQIDGDTHSCPNAPEPAPQTK